MTNPEYKDQIDEYAQNGLSIEKALSCPLGASYFYKFLSEEFNKEVSKSSTWIRSQ